MLPCVTKPELNISFFVVAGENELHVKDVSHDFDENEAVVNNLTLTKEESPAKQKEEQGVLQEVHSTPDIIMEEDGGHFNKNKDKQPRFSTPEDMHQPRQDILESSLDADIRQGLDVDPEHLSSGW